MTVIVEDGDPGGEVDAVQAAAALAAAHEAGAAGAEAEQASADAAAAQATAAEAQAQAAAAQAQSAGAVSAEEARRIAREEMDAGMARLADVLAPPVTEPPAAPPAGDGPPKPDELPPAVTKQTGKKKTWRERWEG